MSNRWPGGLIRKTPVTPAGPLQSGAAPGMWTLAEASYWVKQGLWPTQGNILAVEDVFSTYLYTGNGATQTITTGIDLAGKGGMLWIKARTQTTNHIISDTVRGAGNFLMSNASSQQFFNTDNVSALSSTGFSVGVDSNTNGTAGAPYVSWTFREAPNFFDVVTYTGDGVAGRQIAHNLGVAPGMITAKATSTTSNWAVWHRYNGTNNAVGFMLNGTAAPAAVGPYSGGTSTYFNVDNVTDNNFNSFNQNGVQYVAYLFAHNTASDGLIQCGSYTTTGADQEINLGWEPQWVLIKNTNIAGNAYTGWGVFDTMRGFTVDVDNPLLANRNNAENGTENANSVNYVDPTATGFRVKNGTTLAGAGSAGYTYIYVAIRRGPMRTPTLGTSVYNAITTTGTGTNSRQITGYGFNPDFLIFGPRSQSGYNRRTWDRLRNAILYTDTTSSEAAVGPYAISSGALQNGYIQGTLDSGAYNQTGTTWVNYGFGRAPGFFDEVCYTGTGSATTFNHNLGVVPELMIVKRRETTGSWIVGTTFGATTFTEAVLNSSDAGFFISYDNLINAAPTSTTFSVGSSSGTNGSGSTYVAYLFASVPGVSKVGSYTGNGSSQTINCAFTTGARFVMIKRTDSTGDWYVWDSARGIVAGNDPYLALNSTAAEVTSNDSVDTDNTGFVVNQVAASNINVNAATYIFLAIA